MRTQPTRSLPTRARSSGVSLCLTALVVLLSACAGTARATSLKLEGTADLLEAASSIVTGRVVSTEARMREEHKFIYTYVTIEVEEVLKGNTAATGAAILLEELGGQVGSWLHHVDSVPEFEPGERVLVFLEDRDDGLFRTYGMVQGKFRFEQNSRTGETVLTRPQEWTETYFAALTTPRDLTVVRADGSYAAEPLLAAIRDWVALH